MDATAVVLGVIGLILSTATIRAIYYGPIAALKIQRELDEEREARNRKVQIFKTLMSYRVTRLWVSQRQREHALQSLSAPREHPSFAQSVEFMTRTLSSAIRVRPRQGHARLCARWLTAGIAQHRSVPHHRRPPALPPN